MTTKTTLIETIAAEQGLSKAKSKRIVDGIFDTIVADVAKGETATIKGFGTFSKASRAERTCINPQTKEKMTVEAKAVPHFKAGTEFKAAVK